MLPTRTGRLWLGLRWGLALAVIVLFIYSSKFLLAPALDSPLTMLPIKPLSSTTRVAFLADAGLNKASKLVLEMLRNESVEMVLHSGDLDYTGKATEFYRLVDRVLGRDFPYFVTMGNYESKRLSGGRDMAWHAYQKLQRERLGRIDGLKCATVTNRNLACELRGVSFVTSAIGVNGTRLGLDLQELQAASIKLWGEQTASWRICSWHLPLANFQVGFREGVPWMNANKFLEAYEHCRRFGAMIVNGHEHYYVRSHTIHEFSHSNVQFQHAKTNNTNNALEKDEIAIGPGSTLAVVSGLGGHSVSIPSLTKVRELDHLAVVHPLYLAQEREVKGKYFFPLITGDKPVSSSEQINLPVPPKQGYPFGALICELQATPKSQAKGECYFKTIAGTVVDRFTLARF